MKTTTLHYCRMIYQYIEVSRGAYLTWHTDPALANFYQCRNPPGRTVQWGGVTFINAIRTFVQVIHVQMEEPALDSELLLCKIQTNFCMRAANSFLTLQMWMSGWKIWCYLRRRLIGMHNRKAPMLRRLQMFRDEGWQLWMFMSFGQNWKILQRRFANIWSTFQRRKFIYGSVIRFAYSFQHRNQLRNPSGIPRWSHCSFRTNARCQTSRLLYFDSEEWLSCT